MSNAPPVTTSASHNAMDSSAAPSSSLYGSTIGRPPAASTASAYACFSSYRGNEGRAGRASVSPTSGVSPTTGRRRRSPTGKRLLQSACGRLRVGCVAKLADGGSASSARARDGRCGSLGDAADRHDRYRPGSAYGALETGETVRRWKRRAGFRSRLEYRSKAEVVGASRNAGIDLGVGMGGDSYDRIVADALARGSDREVLLADVHSVGTSRASDIRAVVDEEERVSLAAHRGRVLRDRQ